MPQRHEALSKRQLAQKVEQHEAEADRREAWAALIVLTRAELLARFRTARLRIKAAIPGGEWDAHAIRSDEWA